MKVGLRVTPNDANSNAPHTDAQEPVLRSDARNV